MTTLVEEEVEAVAIALSLADPDERPLPEGAAMADFYRGLACAAIAALKRAEPAADVAALCERLGALYVWPQSVADHYADTLTPRQIEKLYEIGGVADEAAAALTSLSAQLGEAREVLRQAMNALGTVDNNDPMEPIADNGMTVWDGMRLESKRLWKAYRAFLARQDQGK